MLNHLELLQFYLTLNCLVEPVGDPVSEVGISLFTVEALFYSYVPHDAVY